ncbi:MAG: hypothetical protein Q8P67_27555 [archaeon]|nr:hypothetical protein [archaeon]
MFVRPLLVCPPPLDSNSLNPVSSHRHLTALGRHHHCKSPVSPLPPSPPVITGASFVSLHQRGSVPPGAPRVHLFD